MRKFTRRIVGLFPAFAPRGALAVVNLVALVSFAAFAAGASAATDGPAADTSAEPVKVTVFGDSLVQGYGLVQGEGLVDQLADWLSAQGVSAQLSNAGVSGDTTAGGAARIDWTLAETPDALIVLLGGNDLLRGLDPSQTRANLIRIVTAAQAAGSEVMLVGMVAPGNYGPDFKAEFDAIYPALAQQYDLVLHPYAFAGMEAASGGEPTAMVRYMQGDGIHPNAQGVGENVAAMGPKVLMLIERVRQKH